MKKMLLSLLLMVFSSVSYADHVAEQLQKFQTEQHLPGLVALYYDHGQLKQYFIGKANLKTHAAITAKTQFELGAVSQLFTALLLAHDYDEAQVDLSAPIKQFLPYIPSTLSKISLVSLATGTSGLPTKEPALSTEAQYKTYLQHRSLDRFSVSHDYHYSNYAIGLLGLALADHHHRSLQQLLQHNVFKPLRMPSAGLKAQHLAQGYSAQLKPVTPSKLDLFAAADGIKASALDMQKLLAAAIGLHGLPDSIFYPMRMTQSAFVKLPQQWQGLGWNIYALNRLALLQPNLSPITAAIKKVYDLPRYAPNRLYDKAGSTRGFSSYIAVIPGKLSGVVLMTNKAIPTAQLQQLGRRLLFRV